MRSRGQSETLGFVLVFALIVTTIGVVYATGFTGLDNVREGEQINNAQRAFEVLADNIEDVAHRNAPSRSTEIRLAEAELRIAEAIQLEVNDPDSDFNVTWDLRPVIYDAGTGTEIVYSQGAVIRSQQSGGIVITEGTFVIGENRSLFPVIQTRLTGTNSVSGSTTVLLRAEHSQTKVLYANRTESNKIWFNITSPRASSWRSHLTAAYDGVTCEPVSDDTVSCHVTTDRVYVSVYQIDLSIE